MAEPITLQELAWASENAQSFDSFLNDDATTIVPRRSASDINTLDYYRDYLHGLELVYSQQSGTVTVNGVETKTVTQAVQDAINDNASVFKGDKGDSGTIETFTVSTGAAGSAAQVTLGGTPQARTIAITVPRGDKGEMGSLPNFYPTTTTDTPNVHIASDGTLKRSNDPLNASTRKVGTALGNLVERDANGYPTNNNAIGVGQTWQELLISRSTATTYTNSTGKPICVAVSLNAAGGGNKTLVRFKINSTVDVFVGGDSSYGSSSFACGTCIVPSGATYQVDCVVAATLAVLSSTLTTWQELR